MITISSKLNLNYTAVNWLELYIPRARGLSRKREERKDREKRQRVKHLVRNQKSDSPTFRT